MPTTLKPRPECLGANQSTNQRLGLGLAAPVSGHKAARYHSKLRWTEDSEAPGSSSLVLVTKPVQDTNIVFISIEVYGVALEL